MEFVKVNKEFTLGLSYRSATSVKLSGDTEVNAYAQRYFSI